MNPAANLLIAVVAIAGLWGVYRCWPILSGRWLRDRRTAERERLEDGLKQCHVAEYAQVPTTVQSLAGALEIASNEAAELVTRLQTQGLVTQDGEQVRLTAPGREYALRVIRRHRLWEQFLADRTGLQETEWHPKADRKEHTMTAREEAQLAAQLDNPAFDPHGDPIPTVDGTVPSRQGVPLSTLPAGTTARIVHVEDEPAEVYRQLVAAQLGPGTSVHVLERTPQRLRLEAEVQELTLTPVVAANLLVEPTGMVREAGLSERRLSSLAIGEQATVVDLAPACRGVERRRLLDLGIVPGTVIRAELRSASGEPVAYRIRGAVIALRREQADLIHVQGVETGRRA
jgi:DtxR family Mn-dependent transcriptional regulator